MPSLESSYPTAVNLEKRNIAEAQDQFLNLDSLYEYDGGPERGNE